MGMNEENSEESYQAISGAILFLKKMILDLYSALLRDLKMLSCQNAIIWDLTDVNQPHATSVS